MTLTIQVEQTNTGFLDALRKFVSQWQGVKIETVEDESHYITDEEILSDPETIAAMEECEYILAHPDEFKAYHDVDEMFRDILADD